MTPVYEFKPTDVVVFCVAVYLARLIFRSSRSRNSTSLQGPPRKNLIWGQNQYIRLVDDVGQVYEDWAAKYGSIFKVPVVLGGSRVVLCDPRAISSFYSKETFAYVGTPLAKRFIGNIVRSIFIGFEQLLMTR